MQDSMKSQEAAQERMDDVLRRAPLVANNLRAACSSDDHPKESHDCPYLAAADIIRGLLTELTAAQLEAEGTES